MKLVNTSRVKLVDYVCAQLRHFFPDKRSTRKSVDGNIDEALDRLAPCVRLSKMWPSDFNYLHSNQYAVFLYFLANTIWCRSKEQQVCDKLFYLNKALNSFECFYTIELPEIFCVCHSPGIVLAQASYADYLVLYQNSTVGRFDPKDRPVLEEGVILFPNTAIIGKCHIGPRTVLAQGSSIVNRDSPGNCIAFGSGSTLTYKTSKVDYLSSFFRL